MYLNLLTRPCIVAILVLIASCTAAAELKSGNWGGLKQMMSTEEFQSAGLSKLSPEELRNLDQWILHFLAYDSNQVVKTDETIKELQKVPVRHRIVGHFRGWDGDTVFTLDNGEVWKQRLPGRYAISLDNPEVEIVKNLLGFYELRIVKTGHKIGVTRVK